MEEERPTKEERRVIGHELIEALKDVQAKYPGLELVIAFTLPRPGSETRHAICVVSTLDRPKDIVTTLAAGAREIHEQMVVPFSIGKRDPKQ